MQHERIDSTAVVGGVGGGSQQPVYPSFLVHNVDNVNARFWAARGLVTVWDFLEVKGRIGRTNVVVQRRDTPLNVTIIASSSRSRYFAEGRLYMSRKIRLRLGRYDKVRGLMETLTYDPKKVGKQEAWASFGKDTRRFLNAINEYRKRRGSPRLHYLWVVEVQETTGYPHVHIFFPNLRWLAPVEILNGNWRQGRANVESPKRIKTNCAGYISKYLRKMGGWLDLHLALLWSGGCRMYGFSRGFAVKNAKRESDFQRLYVVETNDLEKLEKGLEEAGYIVERKGGGYGR